MCRQITRFVALFLSAVVSTLALCLPAFALEACYGETESTSHLGCISRILLREEAAMTEAYKGLLQSISPQSHPNGWQSIRRSLAAAQRQWRRYRDAECGAKALSLQGSQFPVMETQCRVELTKLRTALLVRWQDLSVPALQPAYGWK
jgi:uncharacterized protein YecT (DUF1311 family)